MAATAASYLIPEEHAASAVGSIFLLGAYFFALPRASKLPPSHFGLALGGLLESTPVSWRRMLKDSGRALLIASAISVLILPLFWLGFMEFYQPRLTWSLERSLEGEGALALFDLAIAHLLIVALPEEFFFRGYLQTALDDRWKARFNFLGVKIGASLIVVSILFALGHLATTGHVSRLAVFFPSLLFGYLRIRTGGVGAPIILHTQFNLAAALLGAGYGLY